MQWLEEGLDSAERVRRRFLVRNVYLNPVTFGSYRAVYTRTGFRAIDCPPLTTQGKNSADIYMVLDIVDCLQTGYRYDEFVIASADADFTPVLQRLRSQDRRTTVLTAGLSSAAYRAVCDSHVPPEILADVALGQFDEAHESTAISMEEPAVQLQGTLPGHEEVPPEPDENAATVREAIMAAVAEAPQPLKSAAVAQVALKAMPDVKESGWFGTGSFGGFLSEFVGELSYEVSPAPGYVFDPKRHSKSQLPAPEAEDLSATIEKVCVVTGAPALSAEKYAALFTGLSAQLKESPYRRNETEKRVRDRTDLAGASVGRNAINFVTQGLIYSGVALTADKSAMDLARAWLANLESLCRNARLVLTSEEAQEVEAWIVGSLEETAS